MPSRFTTRLGLQIALVIGTAALGMLLLWLAGFFRLD